MERNELRKLSERQRREQDFIKLIGDLGHTIEREHWARNSSAPFKPLNPQSGKTNSLFSSMHD